ncbi:acyl-CoA transferase [Candidimonas sp. SYP-B2681]|nr:acyl-CoA transferase [Candidimonas sp. SYP-B2681]
MQPPSRAISAGALSDAPTVLGAGDLPSALPVTAFAVASISTAARALATYVHRRFGVCPAVTVDRRLASLWFGTTLRPQGWQMPKVRDPITGDYQAGEGWIRLHTNAPHHLAAALSVLGTGAARGDVEHAVSRWTAAELEAAIVQAGGCAAAMRSRDEWAHHPQGRAVGTEPLFQVADGSKGTIKVPDATLERPLAGIKVLDLTRVLAGPVSTRFLAAYGAEVLRIDPPFWTEPGMIPEVTVGKRCALLDFRSAEQLDQIKRLMAQADVVVHGYRADALERLGLGTQDRQSIRPGLVDVCLNAYGWSGPWSTRRGFDSLVQMSNGIAHLGMVAYGRDKPTPLPVQALDQATGYLMAAAVLDGLTHSLDTGTGSVSRLSLARSGELLMSQATATNGAELAPESSEEWSAETEHTYWGPARRLKPPCHVEGIPMHWNTPATALGSSPARWPT